MKKANIFLIFLLLVLSLSLNSIAQKAKFVYTSAGELNVIGRIMPVKSGYHRLDTSAYPDIPAVVKRLLTNSAGMAIVFRTNSTAISAKWCVSAAAQLSNLTPIANKGMDLYIKHNGKWQFAGGSAAKQAVLGIFNGQQYGQLDEGMPGIFTLV